MTMTPHENHTSSPMLMGWGRKSYHRLGGCKTTERTNRGSKLQLDKVETISLSKRRPKEEPL